MRKRWIALLMMILILGVKASFTQSLNQRAVEAHEKGDYKKAIALLKKCIKQTPEDGNVYRWMGSAYYGDGQYREAIDAMNRSLNLPHNKDHEHISWIFLAYSQTRLGQLDSALSSTNKAIELNPNESGYFAFLSFLHNMKEQYDEAITAGKRAIEIKADNDYALYNLGSAYKHKKQFKAAYDSFKRAMEINPKDVRYPEEMGDLFSEMEEHIEAAKAYQKAVDLQPSHTGYLALLAIAYRTAGRYDESIDSADKIIPLLTYSGIGVVLATDSDYPIVKEVSQNGPAQKAGLEVGDKIVKIGGHSTKGWDQTKTNILIGNPGSKVELRIQRAAESKPLEKTVTRESMLPKSAALALGVRSVAHRYKGSLDEALKDAEQAYSLDSASYEAQESLAGAYLETGRYEQAINLLSAIKSGPYILLLKAKAQAKQGNLTEAMATYSSIPEGTMSVKDIPIKTERLALLQMFKPLVTELRDGARSFETKRQYKDALSQLVKALEIADETDTQAVQEAIFNLARKYPALSEMTDDARKHLLRAEILVKETNFEEAAAEYRKAIRYAPQIGRLYFNYALISEETKNYPEAIRSMKLYIKAIPDAPDAQAAKDAIVKWEFALEREKGLK